MGNSPFHRSMSPLIIFLKLECTHASKSYTVWIRVHTQKLNNIFSKELVIGVVMGT